MALHGRRWRYRAAEAAEGRRRRGGRAGPATFQAAAWLGMAEGSAGDVSLYVVSGPLHGTMQAWVGVAMSSAPARHFASRPATFFNIHFTSSSCNTCQTEYTTTSPFAECPIISTVNQAHAYTRESRLTTRSCLRNGARDQDSNLNETNIWSLLKLRRS